MDECSRLRQFEDRFLRQLRTRAQQLIDGRLPADRVVVEAVPDGIDGVRATLARLGRYERGLLDELPGTRAVQLRFERRVFGPLRRTCARLRAQALAPIEALVAGEAPGPIGRELVLDALARYELLPRHERPTAVALASATGFTPDARALVHAGGGPTLVLLSGRADGGWDVTRPATVEKSRWAALFELETEDERLRRLLYHLERSGADLEARGLSVPELAERLGLPREQVEPLLRHACRCDPRLMTVVHEGVVHVCRSPLVDEGRTMSLLSWIRRLLRLKPSPAEQVRALTAQRVRLEQQRHELDQRLQTLEKDELEAVERGAAAKTDVERKQLAGRLVRTRRELRRVRAQAALLSQQIDILGTHIHNLTLAQQGRQLALPKAEELTQVAAEAEQIMSEVAANADLAAGIEVGAATPLQDEEEAAILAEFKEAAVQQQTAAGQREAAPSAATRAADHERAVAPPTADKSKARPELG